MSAKQILIINGPNLNLLGKREPDTYGAKSFEEYFVELKMEFTSCSFEYIQSNLEGEIVTALQMAKADGIILNAAGYTHTSVAIRDAIAAIEIPVIEVHISNISSREPFRHESMMSPVAQGCIFGFGLAGYRLAVLSILD